MSSDSQHSQHQAQQMARNPKQNKTLAKPSAVGTSSLSGQAAAAKSKYSAGHTPDGGFRAPSGSAKAAADPIRRKPGA